MFNSVIIKPIFLFSDYYIQQERILTFCHTWAKQN